MAPKESVLKMLKVLLKNQRITYRDLAEELKMSESGVKKVFMSKDFSLGRLQQILDVLGLSMSRFFQLLEEQEILNVPFTPKQEKMLLDSPTLFRVFWFLVVEDLSAEEIRKQERISKDQMNVILLKLENLDLIRLGRGGRLLTSHKGLFRWPSEGPLVRKLNSEWSRLTLEKSLKAKNENSLHRLAYLKLSKKSRAALIARVSDLFDDFARLSQKEKFERSKQDLLPLSILFAASDSGFF